MLGWWIHYKLHRAEKHIDDLDSEIKSFLDGRPYRLTSDFTSNGDGTTIWERKAEMSTQGWIGGTVAFPLGDAVHNMRASLDYIVSYLWVCAGRSPMKSKAVFPICLKRSVFERSGRDKISGLPAGAQAVIEGLQPYARDKRSDKLWILHKLDIIDKHRMINLSGYSLPYGVFFDPQGVANVRVIRSDVFPGPFQQGTVLARAVVEVTGDRPGEMDMADDFAADLAFDEAGPASGLLVVKTIREILDYIRTEVIPPLEPFGESWP
jgi:hypothetical protein